MGDNEHPPTDGISPTPTPTPTPAPALAAASAEDGGGQGNVGDPTHSCPKPLHWIGVRIQDEDGNLVTDVTTHLKLTDGDFDVDMTDPAVGADGVYRTDKILNATTAEFSFPALYDLDWWPEGGTGADSSAGQDATVGESECILSVAERLGFRNYHDIWDEGANQDLKDTRPNPNMLVVGDALKAPDQKTKVEEKATDKDWTFVVRSKKPVKLRIVLSDNDGQPLASKAWVLATPGQNGTTGADGLIEVTPLDMNLNTDTLRVTMSDAITPPAPPAAAPAPPDSPPYPPPIVAADFKDNMPDPDYSALVVEWTLAIGGLPSFNVKEGVLARLHNLGFSCDVDSDDDTVAKAVKAYQRLYLNNKNGSGVPADIQADIRDRHDNP